MGLMDRDYYREKIREIEENRKDKRKYLITAIVIVLIILILFFT